MAKGKMKNINKKGLAAYSDNIRYLIPVIKIRARYRNIKIDKNTEYNALVFGRVSSLNILVAP